MDASIIIRTYNEQKFLGEALEAIKQQNLRDYSCEVVLVDSGSTDGTIKIAEQYNCRIVMIKKSEFTFGRSLNIGCEAARGRFLVFISGHCVPYGEDWLYNLVKPLAENTAHYCYGRQIGREGYTKFSENLLLEKYFPSTATLQQGDFFCNNANAALSRDVWDKFQFDESLTGLEDMALAKQLVSQGYKIAYAADAPVEHIHEESWKQVKRRYEREAIALQSIMPEVHIYLPDLFRYTISGIFLDLGVAIRERKFLTYAAEIFAFRIMQYWGSYVGNNDHRKLSKERREQYFYPR